MDLGADLTFNSIADSGYVRKLKEATNGGAHAAIVFSAAQRAYTDAPKILRYVHLPRLQPMPNSAWRCILGSGVLADYFNSPVQTVS